MISLCTYFLNEQQLLAPHDNSLTPPPRNNSTEISGQEAAGVAVRKEASRVGEEIGNIGKRVVDFASEQPGAAGLAAGAGAAALLMRKRKQQM